MRSTVLALAIACALGIGGCRKHKPVPLPFTPPPLRPPAPIVMPEIAPPPELSLDALLAASAAPWFLAPPPLPAFPKPVSVPAPPQAQTQSPQVVLPELRPILTPGETRELERAINDRMARAQALLRGVEGKRMSAAQRATADQVRTFIRQAEEARNTDLLRANNLAERAEVLASDLAAQLR